MKRIKSGLILTALFTVVSFGIGSPSFTETETVANVDIEKYSGKWYEIASLPQYFQMGCMCTTAEYTQIDDYIRVLNQCQIGKMSEKYGYQRKLQKAEGKAFVVEGTNNSKLKVQFAPPFKADYWIVDRDDAYSYAVVSNPDKKFLWILSRTPRMKPSVYEGITSRLIAKGYDLTKLKKTLQHCGN